MKIEKYLGEAKNGPTATEAIMKIFRQKYKALPGSEVEGEFGNDIVYITEISEEYTTNQKSFEVSLGTKIGKSESAWYNSDDLIPA